MNYPRNTYLAFDHREDELSANDLERSFREQCNCIRDPSKSRKDDDATAGHLTDESLDGIERSSALFVLLGPSTSDDPFVDWEIRQSLHRGHGIVILRRTGEEHGLPPRAKDNLESGFARLADWPTTRAEMEVLLASTINPPTARIRDHREPAPGRPPRNVS